MREIRIDLARLSDELFNITKFFGDWHVARLYQGRADQNNRWMFLIEASVILLFVIETMLLILQMRRLIHAFRGRPDILSISHLAEPGNPWIH